MRLWRFFKKGVHEGVAAVLALVNMLLLRVRDLEASLAKWQDSIGREQSWRDLSGEQDLGLRANPAKAWATKRP